MKIKILFLLFFISGLAGAQEKIVPMPLFDCWPLSSPLLDSVDFFTAKKISKLKIKMSETLDTGGIPTSRINYDRNGRSYHEQELYGDTILIEEFIERNAEGQITKINITNFMFGKITSTAAFGYKNNIPYSYTRKTDGQFSVESISIFNDGKIVANSPYDNNSFDTMKVTYTTEGMEMTSTKSGINPVKIQLKRVNNVVNLCYSDSVVMSFETENYKVIKMSSKRIMTTEFYYNNDGMPEYKDMTMTNIFKPDETKQLRRKTYKYYYYED